MNTTPQTNNDFFTGCITAPLNRILEIDLATAAHVGLDGVSVTGAEVNAAGKLILVMSDGRSVDTGRVTGLSGLKGVAGPDTVPDLSLDPQLYIATEKGPYGHFRNSSGQPVQVDSDNTIAFLFCPGGCQSWEVRELAIDLKDYRKRNSLTCLSSKAPLFSNYPPYVEAVPGLYDEATGRFNLQPGQTTVTSQTEVFGRIVYTGCSHIMIGFNATHTIYLETATGRCLCMDVTTRETHYHREAFAGTGVAGKYVRVNTYHAASQVIDVEESDDGRDFRPYVRINRGAWPEMFITYRTIGFYQPGENGSRILSVGASDRLMLDELPVLPDPGSGVFEVLVPSDNFAGISRRRVGGTGKVFTGKRILLFGDSITGEHGVEPGTYAERLKQKLGAGEVVCFGHSGRKLGSAVPDRSDSLTEDGLIGHLVSVAPDVLILQGGVGDYWSGIPLGDYYGDIEDMQYVRTATGGLRYLLHHLSKNLPDGRLMFVTPPPGTYGGLDDMSLNGAGRRMDEYVECFRGICREYHVPVCDFWGLAGWSPGNEAVRPVYTTDGVHLSVRGYERLTDLLAAEASRYL